jgi:hypothetical protein
MDQIYLQSPSDAVLESRSGRRRLGDDGYAAVQSLIVAIQRRDAGPLRSPPVWVKDFPAGSEFSIQDRRATVTRYIEALELSVQEAARTRFASEILNRIGAEVGFSGALPSAKALGEIQAKAGLELTQSIEAQLAGKRSFELDRTWETSATTTYRPSTTGANGRRQRLFFYLALWPWRWDFYVYRMQYLRLQYRSAWPWREVRKTISETHSDRSEPLFRLRYYQPQDDYSFTDEDYVPDVPLEEVHAIKVEPLGDPMPDVPRPRGTPLEDMARLAFPVTKAEKATARTRRVGPQKASAGKTAVPKSKVKSKSKAKPKSKAKRKAGARTKARSRSRRRMAARRAKHK